MLASGRQGYANPRHDLLHTSGVEPLYLNADPQCLAAFANSTPYGANCLISDNNNKKFGDIWLVAQRDIDATHSDVELLCDYGNDYWKDDIKTWQDRDPMPTHEKDDNNPVRKDMTPQEYDRITTQVPFDARIMRIGRLYTPNVDIIRNRDSGCYDLVCMNAIKPGDLLEMDTKL